MLITELKPRETIVSLAGDKKVFIINCHGCKEVHFPEKEAVELQKEMSADGKVTGIITTDYICNPENMKLRLEKHMGEIEAADVVLVLSCGVGVLRYIRAAGLPGSDSSGVRLRPVRRVLSEPDGRNLPDHSLFQEPCQRPVRRFQERQMRSGQQHGVRLGAHLQTP